MTQAGGMASGLDICWIVYKDCIVGVREKILGKHGSEHHTLGRYFAPSIYDRHVLLALTILQGKLDTLQFVYVYGLLGRNCTPAWCQMGHLVFAKVLRPRLFRKQLILCAMQHHPCFIQSSGSL